jgi:hypothetical protein
LDAPDGVAGGDIFEQPGYTEALVRLFADTVDDELDKVMVYYVRLPESMHVMRSVIVLGEKRVSLSNRTLNAPQGDNGVELVIPERRHLLLRKYLPVLYGQTFRWPERPHLVVTFMSYAAFTAVRQKEEATERYGLHPNVGDMWKHDAEDPACVIAPGGKAFVPTLLGALKAERTRYHAARILGDLGIHAKDALPELRRIIAATRGESFWDAIVEARRTIESAVQAESR